MMRKAKVMQVQRAQRIPPEPPGLMARVRRRIAQNVKNISLQGCTAGIFSAILANVRAALLKIKKPHKENKT